MAVGGDTSHRSPQARQCLEEELAGLREREDLPWVDEQINEIVVRLAGSEPLRDAADLPDGTVVTLRFEDGTVTARSATRRPAPAGRHHHLSCFALFAIVGGGSLAVTRR